MLSLSTEMKRTCKVATWHRARDLWTVFGKFFYRCCSCDCDENHNSPWVYFFFALPQAAARFLHITLTSVGNSTRQKRHLISWTKHAATAWEFLPRMPLEPRGTPMVCGRKGRWRLNCKVRRRDHNDIYNQTYCPFWCLWWGAAMLFASSRRI